MGTSRHLVYLIIISALDLEIDFSNTDFCRSKYSILDSLLILPSLICCIGLDFAWDIPLMVITESSLTAIFVYLCSSSPYI